MKKYVYSYKYNLYARRSASEHWTPWTVTNDVEFCRHHIDVIESYGWQWEVR